jgi:glutamate-1-semialdehyde 2,1-aminomutase
VTGFRIAMGGAQEYFNVEADLMTLGKIVGGGFPIGVFGGNKEYMENVTPLGQIHNAGTFNAHPVSVAAGLATIKKIEKVNAIEKSSKFAYKLASFIEELIGKYGLKATLNRFESMFQIFFTKNKVYSYRDVETSNKELYLRFHRLLMERGVYFAPSQYETCFTSSAHTEEDLETTYNALEEVFREIGDED